MEAVVTLKLTVGELDAVREALRFTRSNEHSVANDRSTDPKLRQEARGREAQLALLVEKLNG